MAATAVLSRGTWLTFSVLVCTGTGGVLADWLCTGCLRSSAASAVTALVLSATTGQAISACFGNGNSPPGVGRVGMSPSPGGPGGGSLGAAICLAGGGAGCSLEEAAQVGAAAQAAGGAVGGTEAPQVEGGAATAASEFLLQPPRFQEFHSTSRQPSPLQLLLLQSPPPLQLLLVQSSPPLRFVMYDSRHEAIVKEKAEIAN